MKYDKETDEGGKKIGVSMERSKTGMKYIIRGKSSMKFNEQ